MKSFTASLLLVLAMIQVAMSTTDPATFFKVEGGDLTKIVWAHAVNSKEKLTKALNESNVNMLEADVVMGHTKDNNTQQPIMAHPPNDTSDLSLQEFLKTVIEQKNITKGVKLDFKTIEALNASKEILNATHNDLKFPLFINADILPGPVNATTTPVNAKEFFMQTKSLTNCTLSVGWTTRYGTKDNVTEGGYTTKQIEDMVNVLKEQQVVQPITYPVRAGPAANSVDVIKKLMESSAGLNSTSVTLTVWSSEGDKVDAAKLSALIKDIGLSKVYVDVPDDLKQKLTLSTNEAPSVNTGSFMLATSFMILLLSGYL